ncbi:flagellar basal-body rod protein [Buchnera aphidicola (Nipponaphis monzeni)]|uniref:Flagellar basal-body rod protein FlgC n=1 Tax=Buchnera aphidicola (Nipponaphis monzeni) TaxID=2495405 RepID=A0A455TAC3_9GAMM|nr:flagellar basal body rod protein FlgC [Buchnera aphidicola]BBI01269.1 flagellar basal-body rod protein [Buchnera aphidicola (Nipponaphis monzeni)]
MSLINILNIAASGLEAQSKKLNVSASNLANSESMIYKHGKFVPYTAKQIVFKYAKHDKSKIGGINSYEINDIKTPFKKIYDPSHPLSNTQGYVRMPNVDVINETINGLIAARSYQANIEVINTVKNLITKTLTIGQ